MPRPGREGGLSTVAQVTLFVVARHWANQNANLVLTRGVLELGAPAFKSIIEAVRVFDDFTEGNDPYQELDFGAFDEGKTKIFWKIDYYDMRREMGSKDLSNAATTWRVLTIMTAREW